MTPVVYPLVHCGTREDRRRPLFSRDEIQRDEEQHPCEDQPRQHLADRKSWSRYGGGFGMDSL